MAREMLWNYVEYENEYIESFAKECNVSPLIAKILLGRGINRPEDAKLFFDFSVDNMHDPFLLPHMKEAVARVKKALDGQESILVYGDYDVDGMTSASLLFSALIELGAKADFYIPNRLTEGYGLNKNAIQGAAQKGVKLIITVDCGISYVEEIRFAGEIGVDVIVTDHHEPPTILPPAIALVNPKLVDSVYPFKELAGVGVAFKLVHALYKEFLPEKAKEEVFTYLELAAFGTVADVVPLYGENRIIVKNGLDKLNGSSRFGLISLIKVAGLENKKVEPGHISFMLAPRLNAVGRMGKANLGVELLLTKDQHKADEIARLLDQENQVRQKIEEKILTEATRMVEESAEIKKNKVIVLASPDWHSGVIGIAASKLMEKYYCPVVFIAIEDGVGKGSARSIPGFNLYEALTHCQHLFVKFGGHSQAAGLSILPENIPQFTEEINKLADEILKPEHLIPKLAVESVAKLDELTHDVVKQLDKFAPFGFKNPIPVFASHELKAVSYRCVGNTGAHLKLKLSDGKYTGNAIGFHMGEFLPGIESNPRLDLAFTIGINDWDNTVQMMIRDIKIRQASHSISKAVDKTKGKWETIDRRKSNDKISYLRSILKENSVLAFLDCTNDIEKLYAEFECEIEEGGLKLVAVSSETDDGRLNSYSQEDRLLVCVVGCFDKWPYLTSPKHVVFYHSGLSMEEFRKRISLLDNKEVRTLHFIYNEDDIKRNLETITSRYPDRAGLAKVYVGIKELVQNAGKTTVSLDEIGNHFAGEQKNNKYNENYIENCLNIFTELGLVKNDTVGRTIEFLLKSRGEKADLFASPTFARGQKLIGQYKDFSIKALEFDLDKLVNY